MPDNIYQHANNGFKATVYAALVTGAVVAVAKQDNAAVTVITENIAAFLLFLFLALFNLKTYFDDHKHFGELYQCDELWERAAGITLAFLSWIFMSISAALIYRPRDSAAILAISLAISSLWVVVHLVELWRADKRPQSQNLVKVMRQQWLLLNVIYITLLVLYVAVPVVNGSDVSSVYMLILIVSLCYDMATSDMTKGTTPKRRRLREKENT